ncbi:MAG: hypothetical protein JW878_11145 [Methanomicrobia archaeon]|nr:hypothetical protein [Methanomicrobia archaeon]
MNVLARKKEAMQIKGIVSENKLRPVINASFAVKLTELNEIPSRITPPEMTERESITARSLTNILFLPGTAVLF